MPPARLGYAGKLVRSARFELALPGLSCRCLLPIGLQARDLVRVGWLEPPHEPGLSRRLFLLGYIRRLVARRGNDPRPPA